MHQNKNCTFNDKFIATLLCKRNSIIAVGIGIIAAYAFLVILFLWKVENMPAQTLISTLLGLFCTIISILFVVVTGWKKLNKTLNKSNNE